jgi:hypothetical protein
MKLNSNELKKKIQELIPEATKIKRTSKRKCDETGYIHRVFMLENTKHCLISMWTNITDEHVLSITSHDNNEKEIETFLDFMDVDGEEIYNNLPRERQLEWCSKLSFVIAEDTSEEKIYIKVFHSGSKELYQNDFDLGPIDSSGIGKYQDHEGPIYSFGTRDGDPNDRWCKQDLVKFNTDNKADIEKIVKYLEDFGIKQSDKLTKKTENSEEGLDYVEGLTYYYKINTPTS